MMTRQEFCKAGHPLSGDNVKIGGRSGERRCRLCAHRPNRHHIWVGDRCTVCWKAKIGSDARLSDDFWAKVEKSEGCWIWKGAKNCWGYGYFGIRGVMHRAHRVAWKFTYGDWPKLVLDHLCGNRLCVNVAHLKDVSQGDNVRRAVSREYCKRGHRMADSRVVRGGKSRCGECLKAYAQTRAI